MPRPRWTIFASHKRNEEANRFEATLDQAIARDCVVKVQWTGDADVDVMVKEPAGTVCSLRNQRTTSGGMLLGDQSSDTKASIEGHVAVYSCPKAFSGNYQLLIRRVFGKLTTGKVSVKVITHYNTKMAKTLEKKIPLDGGEALVKFDVADGRRKESIQEQQVVNAAVAAVAQRNLANHPEILAQQFAALNDPAAAAALGAVQQRGGRVGRSVAADQPVGLPLGLAQRAERRGGLPADHHHLARRHEHGGDRRGVGRPALCPHHVRAVVLGSLQGPYVQHG